MTRQLGRWSLIDVIGRGAAGEVWSASDGTREVTAKVVTPDDAKAVRSLRREADILALIDHPGVPRVIEAFGDPPALVLDVPPSRTFGDLLSRGELWTIPLSTRLNALSSIAGALDDLHAQGVIHRDIKPAHITASDPPVLLDFGIAQIAGDDTVPDADAGTAAYMPSPGEGVSPARDIYAFAITVYEILLGAHPLLVAADRDITPAVLRERAANKLRSGSWRKPSRIQRPELPPDLRGADLTGLDWLFERALGDADSRPESLRRWIVAVRAAVPESYGSGAPDVLPEAFAPSHTAQEVAASLQTENGGGHPKWRAAAFITAVATVLASFIARLSGRR